MKQEAASRKEILEKFTKVANAALRNYPNLSGSTMKLLDYSENTTYLVEESISGEKYILRVCRPGYHTLEEIETELFFIHSVDKHTDVAVSTPISGIGGKYIFLVSHHDEKYICILFKYLAGSEPDIDDGANLIHVFEKIGEISAQVHNHVQENWNMFNKKKRLTWDYDSLLGNHAKWGRWQDSIAITPERLELFEQVSSTIKKRLESFGKGPEKYGLIHCDLRPANLLVEGEKVKVIDFDDSGFSYYLYDLAASLSFIEHRSYVPKLIERWLKGYRKVRHLSLEEEQEIPTFIMMRRLQILAWLGTRDNETTDEMSRNYTEFTEIMAREYLKNYS